MASMIVCCCQKPKFEIHPNIWSPYPGKDFVATITNGMCKLCHGSDSCATASAMMVLLLPLLWLHIPNFFKHVVASYLLTSVVGSVSLPAAIPSAIVAGRSQFSFLYTRCRVLCPHLYSLPGNRLRFS